MKIKTQTSREAPAEAAGEAAEAQSSHVEADLAHLRSLIEQSQVDEARAFVKELEDRWPDEERVKRWARVIAPPKVIQVGPDPRVRPLDREREWLRQHAREYPGCWLAVLGDELLAADPDLGVVMEKARQQPGGDRALLHLQPPWGKPK